MFTQLMTHCFIIFLILFNSSIHAEEKYIPLYGIFETSVKDNTQYNNPFDYSEVSYSAEFTSSNKKAYQVSGFYNGANVEHDNIWLIRFMPSTPGQWHYTIKNNQGENIKAGQFRVSETAAYTANHGHIKVDSKNPKYLIHQDGTPHYWVGGKWISARDYGPKTKAEFINKGIDERSQVAYGYKTNQQLIDYLDLLVEYKHNGILLKIGQYPLQKDRLSWDLEWIQRGEWLVNEALKRGIYVQINLFDTWSRDQDNFFSYNMQGSGQAFDVWNDGDDHLKQNYLQSIISRFASFANVYWELGNEMGHSPNCGKCFSKLANDKYIPWIKAFDPYNLPIGLSEEMWRVTNVEIGFLHQTQNLPDSSIDRPVIMNELVGYELEQSLFEKLWRKLFNKKLHRGLWHDNAINNETLRFSYRRTFWKVFTHGGSGSSEATWLDINRQLSDNVLAVMKDHMHLSNIIQKFHTDLNTMYPLDNLFITTANKAQISSRGNGNIIISYFDAGYKNKVKAGRLNLSDLTKNYNVTWMNPSTGAILSRQKLLQNKTQLVQPEYTQDLVLILQSLP